MSAKLIAAALAKAKRGRIVQPPRMARYVRGAGPCGFPLPHRPKWDEGIKVRYHKCKADGCLLAKMGAGG